MLRPVVIMSMRLPPPRSRRVILLVAGAAPYAMRTVAWFSIQTRGRFDARHAKAVLAAWPELSEAIKAGILAMVKAAKGSGAGA